jgi:hypothetical protein
MHIIDDIIISDQVWETRFACDIGRCLGKCCQYGDLGAPISEEEAETIINNLGNVQRYLTREQMNFLKAGISETFKGTLHIREIGANTPCPLSFISEKKEILCSLHAHALTEKIPLLDVKPLWCSMFPLIINKTSEGWMVNLHIPDFCVSIPNPPPVLLSFAPLLEVIFGKEWVEKVKAAYR